MNKIDKEKWEEWTRLIFAKPHFIPPTHDEMMRYNLTGELPPCLKAHRNNMERTEEKP